MYKLLTTAAVIMTVATPSIANDWTGHKDLVQRLEQTYGHLDGQTGFDNLQGEYGDGTGTGLNAGGTATNGGQLSNFFDVVDQGVTYITLTVADGTDPDVAKNTIVPGINEGVAFSQISDAKDELVNRVNYDLFSSTTADGFVKGDDYTGIKDTGLVLDGVPANGTGDNDYTSNQNGGYAGVKITNLVDTTNVINEYLVDSGTSATQNLAFQTAFGNGAGQVLSNTEVDGDGNPLVLADLATDFFAPITSLNSAITLTNDSTNGDAFFGNIDAGNVAETNINDFAIPAYNSFDDIGSAALGHSSISNWANGIYNYATSNGGSGTFTDASGTATIDAANNTITIDGVVNYVAADGTLSTTAP